MEKTSRLTVYRQYRKVLSFLIRNINKQMLHFSNPMLVKSRICVSHVKKLTYS
jgi:hypothetical protein